MKQNRSKDWLNQAIDDLKWAKNSMLSNHYSQTCFIAQQVAEKALKALAFQRGYTEIRSHSIKEIAKSLKINGEIEGMCTRLDLYYISARYPDALPSGAPCEFFDESQAKEAYSFAEKILEYVQKAFST